MAVKIDQHTRLIVHTRPDKLGDHVLLIPILRDLYEQTNCHITLISSETVAPFLRLFDCIADVITMDINAPESAWLSRTRDTIKARQMDVWVSCWNHPSMAKLAFLSRIPIRIGDASIVPLSWYYTHRIPQPWGNPLRHQLDYYESMMTPLGIKTQWRRDWLPLSPHARHTIKALYEGITQPKIMVFLETGGTNIPIPHPIIQAVIPDLVAQGYHVTVCAQAPHDGFMPPVLNMTGQGLSIEELIALLSQCDYYIGGDTAPTHLASLLQKPILFFSPMKNHSPARWGPLSPYQIILRKEYRCLVPCLATPCPPVCVNWVTPQRVMAGFLDLVATTHGPPKTPLEYYRNHAIHTLRCMRIQHAPEYGYCITQSEEDGYVVFTLSTHRWWPHIKAILSFVEDRNINVLLGPIPTLLRWIITGYMGIIRQKIPPIHWDTLAVVPTQLATKAMASPL